MTTTLEQTPRQAPDAGVIEEARARQRRQRRLAAFAALAALAIGAVMFAFGGGGGTRRALAPAPAGAPRAKPARSSRAACLSSHGHDLQGRPSRSLLSILGVLRRPANATDVLPRDLAATGLTRDVFVRYVRRTRILGGSPYYIYPAIIGGCGFEKEREGIMNLATDVDLGAGITGGVGGGGATASSIELAKSFSSGPPGSSTSTTITMIVPDDVARVSLHYPAGPASGYSTKISPAFTITTAPVNNELVVTIPRSSGSSTPAGLNMTWRASDGRLIRSFNRL